MLSRGTVMLDNQGSTRLALPPKENTPFWPPPWTAATWAEMQQDLSPYRRCRMQQPHLVVDLTQFCCFKPRPRMSCKCWNLCLASHNSWEKRVELPNSGNFSPKITNSGNWKLFGESGNFRQIYVLLLNFLFIVVDILSKCVFYLLYSWSLVRSKNVLGGWLKISQTKFPPWVKNMLFYYVRGF